MSHNYFECEIYNPLMSVPRKAEFVAVLPAHRDATVDEMKRFFKLKDPDVESDRYKRVARSPGYHRYVLKEGDDFIVVPMNGSYSFKFTEPLLRTVQ